MEETIANEKGDDSTQRDMSIGAPKSHAAVAHVTTVSTADEDVILSIGATAADKSNRTSVDLDSPDSPEEAIMPATERPEHWEDLEDPSDEPLYRPNANASAEPITKATEADPVSSSAPWDLRIIRCGMASSQGNRHYMEDRQVAVPDLQSLLTESQCSCAPVVRAYFGVFDGHGGECAAEFASAHLLDHALGHDDFPADIGEAMASGFLKTDMAYEAACAAANVEGSGTTAVAAVLWGRDMTVANLGDSRAVISRRGKVLELSKDQKPSIESERKRIVAAGGFVCPEGFLNSVLGVSRAIGNWHVRDHDENLLKRRVSSTDSPECPPGSLHATTGPLISVPEVKTHRIGPDDEFMVLATDGLWDVCSSQRCIEVARMLLQEENDPRHCAEGLVKHAMNMKTTDNVSVQVVCFSNDPPPSRRPSAFGRNLSVDSLSMLKAALSDSSGTMSPISSSMALERLAE